MKRNSLGVYCTFLYAKNQSLSIWAEFFTTDIFLVSKLLKGLKTKLIGGGRARYGREDGNSIQDSYDVKEHLKIKSFGMKRNSLEVSSTFLHAKKNDFCQFGRSPLLQIFSRYRNSLTV